MEVLESSTRENTPARRSLDAVKNTDIVQNEMSPEMKIDLKVKEIDAQTS
jgi:hypothetical protein